MSLTGLLLRRTTTPPLSLLHQRTLAFSSAAELPRVNLHNHSVQSVTRAFDLSSAAALLSGQSLTRPNVFTCNAIIAAMYRAQRYSDAVSLFQFFFFYNQSSNNIVPNIVSYNYLILSHCESGQVDVAIEVYNKMILSHAPSAVTFRHLTKGLVDAGRVSEAVDYLREMLTKGLGADSIVYNNLIKGFLDLGDLHRANEFFAELKERRFKYDVVVNATYMEWFFNQGRGKEAMDSYRSVLHRLFKMTPATGNALLEVLIKHGKKKEAWDLFFLRLDNHFYRPPHFQALNGDSFNIMVNEYFKEGKYDKAAWVVRFPEFSDVVI